MRHPAVWLWLSLLLAPLLLRLLGGWLESDWWGLNQLYFAPALYSIALLAVSGAVLARLNLRSSKKRNGGRAETIWTFLMSPRGAAVAALVCAALFWLLSAENHLFAAGYERIGNLSQRTTPYVHKFEFLATQLTAAVYRVTSGLSERALNDAALAVRVVSIASGAVCVWLWLSIIGKIGRSAAQRSALAAFICFGAASVLFFGAGEFQAPATLIVSLYIWLTVTLIQAQDAIKKTLSALGLILCSALGPLYLGQLAFLVPPTVFILGLGILPGVWRERIWGVLFLLTLAGLVWFVYDLASENLWVRARLALPEGKPPEFDYTMIHLTRISDLANSAFALWPLAPLALWLCARYGWNERCDHVVGSLAALALSACAWIFIADFPGGAARELSTLAPFSIPLALLAGYLWNKKPGKTEFGRRLSPALAPVAFLSFLALAPVHLSADAGVSYLDHDYQNRSERYLGGMINFRDHHFFRKEFTKADRWERKFKSGSSLFLDHDAVKGIVKRGDYSAALRRIEFLLSSHPLWAPLSSTRADIYYALGQLPEALSSIQNARQLAPGDYSYLIREGDIWQSLGAPDSALARYRLALKYVDDNPDALSRLGMLATRMGDNERARIYAYLLFEIDPANAYSYLIIGLAAYNERDLDRARRYLLHARRVGYRLAEAQFIDELLEEIR
ncbi:MAG: tetratricopeptide repeat protein [Candidatus Zixiibacteriota bacterium]